MRITIVEEEIKSAVKTFIASQLTLAEGQDIQIEFKSTRGDDGLTADVTVTLAGTKATPTPVAKPLVRAMPKQTEPETPQTVAETAAVVQATEVPDEAQTAAVDETQAETVQTELGGEEPAKEVGVDEPLPEPETEKPRSSLFAGLKRPENS